MSSRRTSVASSVAPRKPGRRSSVAGAKGGRSRKASSCSSTGTYNIEDSPSSEDREESSVESSVDSHRRKNLEWHERKQAAQLKEAMERRLREKSERENQLASVSVTGTSERELNLLEESSTNQSSDNRVQQNAEDREQPGTSGLKGKAARPAIQSKLLSQMKPFSELPQELWTKPVQPKPKTVQRPPPQVLESSQADEPPLAIPAVDKPKELNVPGTEKENGTITPDPENQKEQQQVANRTIDLDDSRANKRKTPAQIHANLDSKRVRMQQDYEDNNTLSQTANASNQSYNQGTMMTSTPYPNKTAKETSLEMSPVTPDNDTRPSHLIPTQKVKTLTRPPVRDQADVIRRLAQRNSSVRPAQVQSDTEVRKLPPPQVNTSSPQICGNRELQQAQKPSAALKSSNHKQAQKNKRTSEPETQSYTGGSDHDSDGPELFSRTDSERENVRAKTRSRSPAKSSQQSIGSATSTKSSKEQVSARKRKLERRRLREASLPKTFDDSDEETAPKVLTTNKRAHHSRKVSVAQGQQEKKRSRQAESPSQPPSASSNQAVYPQELEAFMHEIFESSVLPPVTHQAQNEVNGDDNQPGPSPKVPEVISSKLLESDKEPRPNSPTSKAAPTDVTQGATPTPPREVATGHEGAQCEEPPAPESETSWDEGIVKEPSIYKPDEVISSKNKKSKVGNKVKVGASSSKPKKSLASRKAAVVEPVSEVDQEQIIRDGASSSKPKKSLASRKAAVVELVSEVDEEQPRIVRKTRSNAQAPSLPSKSKKKSAIPVSAKKKSRARGKSPTLETSDNELSDVEEDEQPDEPEAGPSGSQLSGSSTRSRQSHRRSTFEIARSSSKTSTKPAKKKKPTPREEVTRYVGNDVFGNYHMLPKKDFLSILNQEQPDHGLNEQQQKQLAIKVNHFLEDFFTQECEATDQPLGFVPFLNLKKVMVDQCLLEEDATGEDLLREMKKSFSKEDWKRSEKVLYPSRYSRKGNNDGYFMND